MSACDPLWEEGKSDLIDRIHELEDAADFEARVAELVSVWAANSYFALCESCPHWDECAKDSENKCHWTILKDARLAVEEEMD